MPASLCAATRAAAPDPRLSIDFPVWSCTRMTSPHRPIRPQSEPAAAARFVREDGLLLYTPAEAARRLRVRESWLRKKAAARLVPCTHLGRHLRFSPADL